MLDLFPRESEKPRDAGPVLVGTSGYSFADWVGPFYPAGTPSHRFLDYYSHHFDTVEVNATYYRIPPPRTLEQMASKTPPGFHFVVKLNKAMTHAEQCDPSVYRDLRAALEPLKAAGKYDGLLAQFPWGFGRSLDHIRHVERVREQLPDEPLFVEFRHDSWLTPELEPWLKSQQLGFCSVDEPRLDHLLPPVTMLTGDDAYVRFHGRNAKNWWRGDRSTRYDYDYSRAELEDWLKKVAELAEKARRTYLFFNNCHAGQAARNAKLMQELLRQQQLTR